MVYVYIIYIFLIEKIIIYYIIIFSIRKTLKIEEKKNQLTKPRGPILGANDEVPGTSPPTALIYTD